MFCVTHERRLVLGQLPEFRPGLCLVIESLSEEFRCQPGYVQGSIGPRPRLLPGIEMIVSAGPAALLMSQSILGFSAAAPAFEKYKFGEGCWAAPAAFVISSHFLMFDSFAEKSPFQPHLVLMI